MEPFFRVATVTVLLTLGGCALAPPPSSTPSSNPSPSTGETTSAAAGEPATEPSLVLATRNGVRLVASDGETTQVSRQPAAVAYGVRDLVVYQPADSDDGVFPPHAGGTVQVWQAGVTHDLGADADSVRLLDAGVVDGEPVALVAERRGADPSTTSEALVLFDLMDGSSTPVVGPQPSWEAGFDAARLLPDGGVVGLYASGAETYLARWSAGVAKPRWRVGVADDRRVELAKRGEALSVVEFSFDEQRNFAPVLQVTPHDVATGRPGASVVIDIRDRERTLDVGLFCDEWLTQSDLACARSNGAPVSVSLDDRSFAELAGTPGAVPSVVRGS